ncbi:MAG: hypothetical protein IJW62_01900 [Clostridia bacterium]|nr:hypothetical protein [Clostridia bacterium]
MKRYLPSLRYVLLILTVILCAWWLPARSEAAAQAAPIDYYGRYALSLEPNAKALLYAYDQLVAGVETCEEEIAVYDGKHPLSTSELLTVFEAYVRDHTEQFWLSGAYSYRYNTATVISVLPGYIMSGSKLTAAKAAYEDAVNEYLSCLDDSMSDFEKELVLHDKLAQSVVYTQTGNAHNSYGALVEGKAVCEGYAEAFQYLLQRAGIQSFVVSGVYVNPDTGKQVNHAWNLVRIDGEYYHTDVTWDDQSIHTYHAYFNLTDTVMQEDHVFDTPAYALPVCDSLQAQYFTVMGGRQGKTYSAEEIAQRLQNGNLQTSLYITESMDAFVIWLNQHISDIAKSIGITGGYSYHYSHLGREFVLNVGETCTHTKLTLVSAMDATCETNGNIAYYQCACGRWYTDSQATTPITDPSSVVIPATGHDYSHKRMEPAYLKSAGADCQTYDVYWYACAQCGDSAGNGATNRYYTGTTVGNHRFTEKVVDQAHFVSGSGADCKSAKQYYYDCAHCDRMGTETWKSISYGKHRMSTEWSTDGDHHWHACTVCDHRSDSAAHADGDRNGSCDSCAYKMSVTPSITEPATTEPATTKPSTTKPETTESVITTPAVTEPTVTEPVTTEPVVTKPITTEPTITEPAATTPATTEPPITKPATTIRVITDPVGTTPVTSAPATSDSSAADASEDADNDGSTVGIILGTVGVLAGGTVTVSVILLRKRKFRVS